MKFFTVLLLASLATTSLAVLPGSEDELPMKTQHTAAIPASQDTPISHTSKEDTSSGKDSSTETAISREELVSEDDVEIDCASSKSQKAQAGTRSGISQLEESTGSTTSAETSAERRLTKLNQAMGGKLGKTSGESTGAVGDIISGASGVKKP